MTIREFRFAALGFKAGFNERGVDRPGRNGNNTNAVASIFDCPLSGLQDIGGLHRSVYRDATRRTVPLFAGNVDDDATLLTLHLTKSVFSPIHV